MTVFWDVTPYSFEEKMDVSEVLTASSTTTASSEHMI
jgi:hypothetical protein